MNKGLDAKNGPGRWSGAVSADGYRGGTVRRCGTAPYQTAVYDLLERVDG